MVNVFGSFLQKYFFLNKIAEGDVSVLDIYISYGGREAS